MKNQIRKKEQMEQELAENQNWVEEKLNAALEEQRKAGLFSCPIVDIDSGNCCTKVFSTSNGLDKHTEKGQHSFPSVNSKDYCIIKMCEPGAMLSPHTLPDRALHTAAPFEITIDLTSKNMALDWHSLGCYCKPGRKETFKKTKHLLEDLQRFFDYGLVLGNTKYDPDAALRELANMKDPLDPDMPKYSRRHDNPHGPLPSVMIIKQWFSGQSTKQKKQLPSNQIGQNNALSFAPCDTTITPFSSARVPIMKELLKTNGLLTTGKKAELYQRLLDNGIQF